MNIQKVRYPNTNYDIWRNIMVKDKSLEDTISETEFTMRMNSVSSQPEYDSQGDSEMDAGAEFEMGLEFLPDSQSNPELASVENLVSAIEIKEEAEESLQLEAQKYPIVEISENVQVISSDLPSPWMDRDSRTNTH